MSAAHRLAVKGGDPVREAPWPSRPWLTAEELAEFNGLANAQLVAAVNAGAHTAPAFAGDTVHAWSEVLDKAEVDAPGVGALRLRLVATKGRDETTTLRGDDGRYAPGVLLDLDMWVLCPL